MGGHNYALYVACVFVKVGMYIPEPYQCSDHSDGWLWAIFFLSAQLKVFLELICIISPNFKIFFH